MQDSKVKIGMRIIFTNNTWKDMLGKTGTITALDGYLFRIKWDHCTEEQANSQAISCWLAERFEPYSPNDLS